jgi:hypothetical protein
LRIHRARAGKFAQSSLRGPDLSRSSGRKEKQVVERKETVARSIKRILGRDGSRTLHQDPPRPGGRAQRRAAALAQVKQFLPRVDAHRRARFNLPAFVPPEVVFSRSASSRAVTDRSSSVPLAARASASRGSPSSSSRSRKPATAESIIGSLKSAAPRG